MQLFDSETGVVALDFTKFPEPMHGIIPHWPEKEKTEVINMNDMTK